MSYGQTSILGLAFQNSFGSPAAVGSLQWFEFVSESVNVEKPPLKAQGMRGIFDEGDTYEGANLCNGDITIEARPVELGWLLKAMFGAPTTVVSGSIGTHTFQPRTSDWDDYAANQPMTIHKHLGDAGSAHQFSDMVGSTLELALTNGEFMTAKLGVVGGTFAQIAAETASYNTGVRFAFDVSSVSIAGAANGDFIDLSIAFDDALEAQHTLNNSKYPSRVKRTGMRTIAVNGTMKFRNQTEYQAFLNQTEQKVIVHLQGPTEIQSGYYNSMEWELPAMRYEESKPAVGGPGYIEVGITAAAKYHVGSATAAKLTLVNTKTAY